MIYLWQFPVLNCRSEVGWSCDSEFITVYLLRKRYARVHHELLNVNENTALCIEYYKQQVLNISRTHEICYGQKTSLDELYIDVTIHTERAQHVFRKEMERNEIFDIKFVRSRQPGIISLMSYSLLWFVKINTELLRGVFTTQRFDTGVSKRWVVNTPRRSSVFIFTNQSNE